MELGKSCILFEFSKFPPALERPEMLLLAKARSEVEKGRLFRSGKRFSDGDWCRLSASAIERNSLSAEASTCYEPTSIFDWLLGYP